MSQAEVLRSRTRIPVVVAPMFLVSGVELVVASCKAGVIGSFPALNGRTSQDFDDMLRAIGTQLEEHRQERPDALVSPYGVNLIVHRSNPRLAEDFELCVAHQVPLVITSLGKPTAIVEAVHGYGGVVISDVTNVEHAKKAAECGVDGLILVCAGAGGHAGRLNPFAFVPAVREFFDGIILLAGCISNGRAVRAAIDLGADLVYIGTRFIPSVESHAQAEFKQMVLDSSISDIVYTPAVSGVHASFMRASLERAGYDLDALDEPGRGLAMNDEVKAWRDTWSAGQGVHIIHQISSVQEIVDELAGELKGA